MSKLEKADHLLKKRWRNKPRRSHEHHFGEFGDCDGGAGNVCIGTGSGAVATSGGAGEFSAGETDDVAGGGTGGYVCGTGSGRGPGAVAAILPGTRIEVFC